MNIINRKLLEKLKKKNRGNSALCDAVDDLLNLIEIKNWNTQAELILDRPDADKVHNDGFYFFNIHIHRTMILFEFEDISEATIVWCGSHDDYERTFKNNRNTITKWLKDKNYIE